MYQAFYGLSAEPFRLTPDHRFSFNHRSYARAKAYLEYGVQRAEGFVMITGRPGTGKTTLINDLLDGLDGSGVSIAKLVSTQVEAGELLRLVAFSFGLDVDGVDKATILQRLEAFLRGELHQGRRAVLIVDEAQDVAAGALEELRLLTNLEFANQPLLQVFLVGQEELREVVHSKPLEQLHQRLIAACHLQPLTARETRAYVEYRLKRVGWQNDPRLADGVYGLIHHFSQGVPRRINQVCSRLLLHGFVEEKHELDEDDVQMVLADLREEMLTPWDERPADEATAASLSMAAARDDGEVTWEENPPVIEDSWAKKKTPHSVAPDQREPEPEPAAADPAPAAAEPEEGGPDEQVRVASPRPAEVPRPARAEPVLGDRNEADEPDDSGPKVDVPPREERPRPMAAAAGGTARAAEEDDEVPAASVYVEPQERRSAPEPEPERKRRRGGGGYWLGAAAVLVAVVAALAAVREVPGPWSPRVEGAEQWLEQEYARLRGWMVEDPASEQAPTARGGGEAGGASSEVADDEQDLTRTSALPTAADPAAGEESAPARTAPVRQAAARAAAPEASSGGAATEASAEPAPRIDPLIAQPEESTAAAQRQPEPAVEAAQRNEAASAQPAGKQDEREAQQLAVAAVQRPAERGAAQERELGSYAALRLRLREAFGRTALDVRPEANGRLFLDFLDPISFDYDSAELEPDYRAVLDKLSGVLEEHQGSRLRIVGYTDSRGSPAYNQYLSEQRAQAVAAYLANQGVKRQRLAVEGRGATQMSLGGPHASRRVDLYLQLQ